MPVPARTASLGCLLTCQCRVTTDHVRVDLGHGIVVTSAVTREAVDLLDLAPGDEVVVVINEANIIVGK
jgi:molybdopterin-binding protein